MSNHERSDIFVAAVGTAKKHECVDMDRDPSFRKATLPMMMAWRALDKALGSIIDDSSSLEKNDWGLVFGTSHGELEVTKDFLVTLATKGLARPILFQNSLHHSTLGFISLKLGISGPGMTVSNHFFSGEDAIAAAIDLIEGGYCNIAVTIAVDTIVTGLESALGQYYPGGKIQGEGAGCLVLANARGLATLKAKALAVLGSIDLKYGHTEAAQEDDLIQVFSDYDADGIEKIALYLKEAQHLKNLFLKKPDGSSAIIRWKNASTFVEQV